MFFGSPEHLIFLRYEVLSPQRRYAFKWKPIQMGILSKVFWLLTNTPGAHCIKLLPEKNSGKIWKLRVSMILTIDFTIGKKLRLK